MWARPGPIWTWRTWGGLSFRRCSRRTKLGWPHARSKVDCASSEHIMGLYMTVVTCCLKDTIVQSSEHAAATYGTDGAIGALVLELSFGVCNFRLIAWQHVFASLPQASQTSQTFF